MSLIRHTAILSVLMGLISQPVFSQVSTEISTGFKGGTPYDGIYPCDDPKTCANSSTAVSQPVDPDPIRPNYYPTYLETQRTTVFDYSNTQSYEKETQSYRQNRVQTFQSDNRDSVELSSSSPSKYYLRFDLGYTFTNPEADFKGMGCGSSMSDMEAPGFPDMVGWGCDPTTYDSITFVQGTFDPVFSKTVGVGYNFSDVLRFDLTLSQRTGMMFNEEDPAGTSPYYDSDYSDGYGDYSRTTQGSLDNYNIMANVYVDLVKRYSYQNGQYKKSKFVPYVGFGFGYGVNRFDGLYGKGLYYVDDGCIDAGSCSVTGTGAAYENQFYLESANNSDVMWAATAGFSFALDHSLSLDVSYKYSDLGTVKTGSSFYKVMDVDANGDGFSGGEDDLDLDGDGYSDSAYWQEDTNSVGTNLIIQEITVGLRYDF